MEQSSPRKVERRIGELESFRTKDSDYFAKVRIGNSLYFLPVSARGTLQKDGTIVHCVNGDRYHPIEAASHIAVDLVYDANQQNPVPGLWAPKPKGRCK